MKKLSVYSRSEVKGISFPRERWREIDKERGNIPRSKFLLTLIEKAYPNIIHNEKSGSPDTVRADLNQVNQQTGDEDLHVEYR